MRWGASRVAEASVGITPVSWESRRIRDLSSSRNAAMVWKRSLGSFASARSRIACRAAGASGFRARMGRGLALMTALSCSSRWRPRNGPWPVIISYRMTPRLNTSVRWSTCSPAACSGDPYPSDPMGTPISVRGSSGVLGMWSRSPWGIILARPKSSTLAWPAAVTMTFEGLMSRCMTPLAWATASASATWIAMESALSESRGRPPTSSLRVRPSTNCMTM